MCVYTGEERKSPTEGKLVLNLGFSSYAKNIFIQSEAPSEGPVCGFCRGQESSSSPPAAELGPAPL